MVDASDLKVRTLGPCRIDSPLMPLLANRQTTLHCVDEDDIVLFDDTRAMVHARGAGVRNMPGFEPADYARAMARLIAVARESGALDTVIMWGLTPRGLKPTEPGNSNSSCRYRINPFDHALHPIPGFEVLQDALGNA